MNKVLNEIKRDYTGTLERYNEEVKQGNYNKANELRESLLGMHKKFNQLKGDN